MNQKYTLESLDARHLELKAQIAKCEKAIAGRFQKASSSSHKATGPMGNLTRAFERGVMIYEGVSTAIKVYNTFKHLTRRRRYRR